MDCNRLRTTRRGFVSAMMLLAAMGCGNEPQSSDNRSPSALDQPEKLQQVMREREEIRQKNLEAEKRALRGKQLD